LEWAVFYAWVARFYLGDVGREASIPSDLKGENNAYVSSAPSI
jgi:hypothetical protein